MSPSTSPAADRPAAPADQAPRSAKLAVTVFPLLIIGGAVAALLAPATFSPLSAGVTYALMIIMFGMGLTLTLPDFALVLRRPVPVIAGVVFQFALMPLLAPRAMALAEEDHGGAAFMHSLPGWAAALVTLGAVAGVILNMRRFHIPRFIYTRI